MIRVGREQHLLFPFSWEGGGRVKSFIRHVGLKILQMLSVAAGRLPVPNPSGGTGYQYSEQTMSMF